QPIHAKKWRSANINITISRSHGHDDLRDFLKQFANANIMICGSAIKFCLVAEGSADLYPRLSPSSEWDTAAAQCILEQAGGGVFTADGKRLCYNKSASLINPHFLAVGDLDHNWQKYLQLFPLKQRE